jgi:alcohol dehydrogenase (cytochrome c)
VNEPVLTTLKVDGKDRKVLMQANRNGFFYVLDRTNGEFIRGNQFIDHQNWADGLDPKTGKPIRSALTKKVLETGEEAEIWPSALGGKNWAPMAYSPKTGLAYVNSLNMGMKYKIAEADWRRGVMWLEADFAFVLPEDGNAGILRAIDPLTGKSKWTVPVGAPDNGGVLATAGDLIFTGHQTGEFSAYDANTGDKLWSYQTASGIEAPPVTWTQGGKQMVAVVSGFGAVMAMYVPHPVLGTVPKGGSVTVFQLAE